MLYEMVPPSTYEVRAERKCGNKRGWRQGWQIWSSTKMADTQRVIYKGVNPTSADQDARREREKKEKHPKKISPFPFAYQFLPFLPPSNHPFLSNVAALADV